MTRLSKVTPEIASALVDPSSRAPLAEVAGGIAPAAWLDDQGLAPIARTGPARPRADNVTGLLADHAGHVAFPVVNGVPVLMWPDAYVPAAGATPPADMDDRLYAEAYAEMAFYNVVSGERATDIHKTDIHGRLSRVASEGDASAFPEPLDLWIESIHDSAAQTGVYRYLAPLEGKTFMQLGGDGRHAIVALLAGARQAVLLTPMIGEAEFCHALAVSLNLQDRLSCVLGLAEALPFADGVFDAIYSPGCLHHMRLDVALPEIRRVLATGGAFAAHEPWRTPIYGVGTWLFGKREHGLINRSQNVYCSPLTPERLAPLATNFPDHVTRNHGPVTRYLLIVLDKLGLRWPQRSMIDIAAWDDRLAHRLHIPSDWGGSIMVGGRKV
jgi:SAM-dependent methyltransferase